MTEPIDIHKDFFRLKQELEKACQERNQAAEYGLEVLAQKDLLQQKYVDLETQYDLMKHELECVKQSLNQVQLSSKRISDIGINQEESLLQESATREAELLRTISDLESEIKNGKGLIGQLKSENDKISKGSLELKHFYDQIEVQNQQMKKDLKELKFREARNLSDYSELEEENITLQKQIAQLKQSQVFYEAMKHENKRLLEEAEEAAAELSELDKLKRMTEKNLEEALQLLQIEREQKHSLKKELDQRIASESVFNLQMFSGLNFSARDIESGYSESPDLRPQVDAPDFSPKKTVDGEEEEDSNNAMSQSIVGDLFSEIHITEVRKLENLVDELKEEKSKLEALVETSSQEIETLRSEICNKNEKIEKLKNQLLELKQTSIFNELVDVVDGQDDLEMDVEVLRRRQQQQDLRYRLALDEINDLKSQLNTPDHIARMIDSLKERESQLKDEIKLLQENLTKSDNKNGDLQNDLQVMTQLANDAQSINSSTLEGLTNITKNIAGIYYLVCEAIHETPNRLMLEHVRGKKSKMASSKDIENGFKVEHSKDIADIRQDVSDDIINKESNVTPSRNENENQDESGDVNANKDDPMTCVKLVDTINDQIAYLSRAVEKSVELHERKKSELGESGGEEQMDLQEQVMKLKAQLATKREQIATLRSVLKANKATAETALATLKQKYESEKVIVTETMHRLRSELKLLKEEAVNFQSVRGMFAQRCDEYVTQLEEQRRQLIAAEEEKKTLNSLLKMAIQQKLALTQKLEDLEFDCERKSMRQQRGSRSKLGKVSENPVSSNVILHDKT
ncbi:hypothetical protein HELRODRAFT_171094 [Helobdella robusta]|uniref:Protein bicaudal D n=1 Tax=Helobdella robusta TaxID=6412 RepID=T1F3T0_HELRO|nr:hypothetical protein HELRODRAFT_171094 [Helobdella robusta]ESO05464.1 hypothetical protein HELRODRAFT_171094 [Helobdella robusta]